MRQVSRRLRWCSAKVGVKSSLNITHLILLEHNLGAITPLLEYPFEAFRSWIAFTHVVGNASIDKLPTLQSFGVVHSMVSYAFSLQGQSHAYVWMDVLLRISQRGLRISASLRVGGVVLSRSPDFARSKCPDSGPRIDELTEAPTSDRLSFLIFVLHLQVVMIVNVVFIEVQEALEL
jgi:hypothetical protein